MVCVVMARTPLRTLSLLSSATLVLLATACGDDTSNSNTGLDAAGGGADGGPTTACTEPPTEKPAASCEVTIASPGEQGANHKPEGTALTYCTNPPSGGDHYPVWAAFKEYSAPVPWPYLVHSMEHGAVVLLYKCEETCPDIVAGLQKVRDQAAADPLCADGTKRIIIMPDPTIPTKVAAAAWGKTYKAECFDEATLAAFVRDNYAKSPENICAPGRPL
jgi:hypothetical protein